MANPPGYLLQQDINKGYRSFSEAVEDQKHLLENEWTGIYWKWIDRKGNTWEGSQL